MKKNLLLAIFSLLVVIPLFADSNAAPRRVNGLLRFIANTGPRNIGLYNIIAKRCDRYMPRDERANCRKAVKRQLELLDYDIVFNTHLTPPEDSWSPDAFVFIAFKQTLIASLADPRTTLYLEEVNKGLNDFLTGANPKFNIWEATLAFYKTPLAAAKVMASLFQDTSLVKLHLAYLERMPQRERLPLTPNLTRLSRIIDSINLILDYSEDNYRGLFYPSPLRENLYRNIYHFYVPLYLSMALASEKVPHKHALAAPMMMTLTYEFITSASDYRYLLKDPERLEGTPTLRDIFAGYCGANFGLGKNIAPSRFTLMRESFARSTSEGVSFLLQAN